MKIRNLFNIAVAFLLGVSALQAQDIHFSQFFASPLNLNPATTGVLSCDLRFSAIYRNQWASVLGNKAFSTFSAGLETRMPVGKNDFYGLGVNLWADRAGTSQLSSIHGSLSGSFIKQLAGGRKAKDMYLVAGGAIGFSQRSINTLNLTFGEQWMGDAYSASASTGENLGEWNNRFVRADIAAGLFWWMALDDDNKSNINAGVAFHHLTKMNISFIGQGLEALFLKTTVHLGGDFRVQRRLAIVPNVIMMFQGPSVEANFGTAVRFDFSKRSTSNQAFEIGPWYRIVSNPQGRIASDAAVIVTRFRYGSSVFGLSYDINVSRLNAATRGNGAFEVSYVYTLCGLRKRQLGCPTF